MSKYSAAALSLCRGFRLLCYGISVLVCGIKPLPGGFLAAKEVDWDTGRHGHLHPAGVWLGSEPVHEMTVFSPSNDQMTISLLLYPDRAPSRWEMAELEEEQTVDTFDKFMDGRTG